MNSTANRRRYVRPDGAAMIEIGPHQFVAEAQAVMLGLMQPPKQRS